MDTLGLLINLIKLNITTLGTLLAMILFVFGGIMPAIIAISLKKNMDHKRSLEVSLKTSIFIITFYSVLIFNDALILIAFWWWIRNQNNYNCRYTVIFTLLVI